MISLTSPLKEQKKKTKKITQKNTNLYCKAKRIYSLNKKRNVNKFIIFYCYLILGVIMNLYR